MKRLATYLVCLLVISGSALADWDGGTQSPFTFGAGARDLSLGGAGIATCDYWSAPFWNPSRLAQAQRFTVGGFHSQLYDSDVAYQYFATVFPTLDWGSFAVGIFRLGVDGIEQRDAGNLLLGEFDDNRLGFYLAYGRHLSGYNVGMAVTFENHSIDTYSATSSLGLNLSLGRTLLFNFSRLRSLSVAVNAKNIIRPGIKLVGETIKYPTELDLGLSLAVVPNPGWDQALSVSARLSKVDEIDARLALGVEYSFGEMLHLRGGVEQDAPAFGAGIGYHSMIFDYAYLDRELGALHMFSFTSAFGMPTGEKRLQRAQEREAEFNAVMSDRLASRNRQMMSDLVRQGKEQLDLDNPAEASDCFDRALFLAHSIEADTTEISVLAVRALTLLDETTRINRYNGYIDSVYNYLPKEDFLSVRHFAGLALTEMPDSAEADSLLAVAEDALDRATSQEEMIRERLGTADSLLNYGKVDRAYSLIKSLHDFAPDHADVIRAMKRAEFDRWRIHASKVYAEGNLPETMAALDSALVLFPGHSWCLELRREVSNQMKRPVALVVERAPAKAEPLSPELLKEVETAYRSAQGYFTEGNLNGAVALWEKVERLAPNYQSVREYLVNAYKFMGIELYGQNRLQAAVDIWSKASQLDPENTEINEYMKRTEREIKKMRELSYEQ